ncbi:hypothetical protein CKO51_27160 [Rhodopirellula sp. SM50]|nr:hypothetical protein [Rhodopirellula sp. SM50]PAY16335.1 hypothetical protein CKO51_27160 [Rhodopirellula sp. SM50]
MRDPDFVYGIVPALGEYGFETQPPDVDTRLNARVQELASSFEWTGLVTSDPVAIAIAPASQILVARYTTDPRDPDGRISLSLNVWIAGDESEAFSLIDELWPRQETSVTKQQFLESSGRRVVGPEKSFVATGFDHAWGAQSSKRSLPKSRSQITRPVAESDSRHMKSSSPMLKAFAALMTVLCFGLAGYCFYLFKENNRNNDDAVQYAQQRDDAQDQLKAIQDGISERERKYADEKNSLESKIESLNSTREELEAEVTRLTRVIASDTDKVDRVELEKLRELRQIVEENIDASQASLDRIKNALPKERTWLSDPAGKSKNLLGIERQE